MSQMPLVPADTAIRQQMDLYAAVVGRFVEKGQPYALLDYPDYFNIGDSAIYAGQLAFLDKHVGRRASCVGTHASSVDRLAPFMPKDGPIFLTGGGNFGDIWTRHQLFRHALLQRFPGRKVVQLPQSLHFRDTALRDETARLIEAHGNFTLLVRDLPSLEFARQHFQCEVILCPDAAPMLWKLDPGTPVTLDLLAMLRDDPEAVIDDRRAWLAARYPAEDWVNINVWTMPIRIGWKIVRSLPDNRLGMAYTEAMYRRQAMMRVMAGARQLARAKFIVTDRLHVHLIASLLRRPHIVMDNSYGKISRYIEAFGQDDLTRRAGDLGELQAAMAAAGHP